MKFEKWQGCGNDFVMVDCFSDTIINYGTVAKQVCDRHYGIGADGLIVILPSEKADLCMRIFNADGSEAEMCGNGIRCFAKMAFKHGRVRTPEFTVETGAGILTPFLYIENDEVVKISVDMGEPILKPEKIPVLFDDEEQIVSEPLKVLGDEYDITCVSMGNPHCVLFFDSLSGVPIEKLGPAIERHDIFPRKTNVEFVEIKDRTHLRMRVWERGAAVTLACGTGACATLTAAVLNGLADRKAEITLDGGKLEIEWRDDNHLYMTGEAEFVFAGEY